MGWLPETIRAKIGISNDSATEKLVAKPNSESRPVASQVGIESNVEAEEGNESKGSPQKSKRVSLHDFEAIRVIGKGSFGSVVCVKKQGNETIYAMKIMRKVQIRTPKQLEYMKIERDVLSIASHPFIVDLFFAFQSKTRLFLVLEYLDGGDLFFHLGIRGCFCESWVRLWAAQIYLALEYLHKLDIIFRDLKPENILFDSDGNIKLVDFGLCKMNVRNYESGAHSFCGTPEYMAPEMLTRSEKKNYGKAVDLWSFGVVVYEMTAGFSPWCLMESADMYQKILTQAPIFTSKFSNSASSLVRGLLKWKPADRLGSGDKSSVRNHKFFKNLNWETVLRKDFSIGFKPHDLPKRKNHSVTENFDPIYTSLPIRAMDGVRESPTLPPRQRKVRIPNRRRRNDLTNSKLRWQPK